MPAPIPDYVVHCQELLSPLGPTRVKRMFGGFGLYADDLFVALLFSDQLYLKADATTRPQFEAAGCRPFTYEAQNHVTVLSFWTPPDDALESPALMLPWARLAMAAALRTRAAKPGAKARGDAKVTAKASAKGKANGSAKVKPTSQATAKRTAKAAPEAAAAKKPVSRRSPPR